MNQRYERTLVEAGQEQTDVQFVGIRGWRPGRCRGGGEEVGTRGHGGCETRGATRGTGRRQAGSQVVDQSRCWSKAGAHALREQRRLRCRRIARSSRSGAVVVRVRVGGGEADATFAAHGLRGARRLVPTP